MPDFENPQSRNEAILQNILGADNNLSAPQSRIETLLLALLEMLSGAVAADELKYLTTAPTSANTSGNLKFVVLSAEPVTKYDGYVYLITGA